MSKTNLEDTNNLLNLKKYLFIFSIFILFFFQIFLLFFIFYTKHLQNDRDGPVGNRIEVVITRNV